MDVQKIIRIALRIFNLHIYNLQYYLIYHTIEGFYVISMGSGYIYIYIGVDGALVPPWKWQPFWSLPQFYNHKVYAEITQNIYQTQRLL